MKLKQHITYILLFFLLLTFIFPYSNCHATTLDELYVGAPSAILMEANTGKILYEKHANDRMYPASTTKIMTAILALENRELSHVAKVSYNAISTVPSGYSTANLQVDEELTIEQLLHVLMIPSANDAANVIAEDIGGSVESFASMMNTKANELGCKGTHFVNPNGVHNENHYSTAYDLALIGQYAMKNETFRKIVSTVKYTLPSTNKYTTADRSFTTTNNLINNKNSQFYSYAIGTKTGYTDAAKNCIVATANKNGMELICVILGADSTTDSNKFKDCSTLFEYGFNNYLYLPILKKGDVYKVVTPINASGDTKSLNILVEDDLNVFVQKSDVDTEFTPEVNLDSKLKAPITKGSVLGSVSYSIYDINYTTNLVAGQDIEANSIFFTVVQIVAIIIILIVFKRILKIFTRSNKGKRCKNRSKVTKKTSRRNSGYGYRR